MKFHSLLDIQAFYVEIGNLNEALTVTADKVPTNEEVQSFISGRSPLVKKIKNHRQSQASKANWRENRYKMMKGIKSFHKSTDGKRMHRKVGRFLATRITRDKMSDGTSKSVADKYESLNAIATLKQHLIVELGYFHKLYEQVELEEMIIDNAMPMLTEIERKVLHDEELNTDELILLKDLIDQNTLIDELSKVNGTPFEKMKEWCEHIEKDLQAKGLTPDNSEYAVEYLKCLTHSAYETKNGVV